MSFDLLAQSGFTGSFSKAGLAEGTNSATIAIAAPNGAGVDYAVNGIAYHKADTDNIAMTALPVQAVSTTCLYLVQIAGGTVSIVKGNEVLTANLGIENNCQIPMPDENNCPLGYIKVETNDSTTFTSGTTDLGAAGITDTYVDFMGGIPTKPVSA
jgi:hypothetical protein